jgi:VWFA-related protein
MNHKLLSLTLALASISFSFAGAYSSPRQQKQVQTLKLKSELVQFDVSVTDKAGNPITDLNKDDFEVKESGKKQDIGFFSLVDPVAGPGQELATQPEGATLAAHMRISPGRTVFIILDPYFIKRTSYAAVDRAVSRLINEDLLPGDQVAIFSTNGKLAGFQQATKNKRALLTAIHAFFGNSDRLAAIDAELAGAQQDVKPVNELADAQEVQDRRLGSLRAFTSVLKAAEDVPGHKVAFFISESSSITVVSSNSGSPLDIDLARLRREIEESRKHGMTVYTIDPRGLRASVPKGMASEAVYGAAPRAEGLLKGQEDPVDSVAFGILNTVDCGCLQMGLSLNSSYYTLAYYPADPFDKEQLRKVKIEVKGRPDLKVYATGFLWTGGASDQKLAQTPKQKRVSRAVASIVPINDLNVAITNAVVVTDKNTGSRVARMAISIDPNSWPFQTDGADHVASFEVIGFAYDVNNKLVAGYDKDYALRLNPEDFSKVMKQGLNQSAEINLDKQGLYSLKVVVIDKETNRLGSAMDWVQAQ